MTTKHHITGANTVYQGAAFYAPLHNTNERRGAPVTFLTKIDMGTPDVADVDGHVAAQEMSAETTYTIDGALAGVNDVPRAILIDAEEAADTTQTCTITGTDVYGEVLVETIAYNGATAVAGKKAFKTITSAVNSANLTGTGTIGTTDVIGLPYRLADASDLGAVWFNSVQEATAPTIVAAVDTTATATTGDTRGTINLNSALDGSQVYVYMAIDSSTKALMVGVDQYGG